MKSSSLAKRGVDASAAFLERCGMTVVERDWRCSGGRIDLVALDGDRLVFVDVKTSTSAPDRGDKPCSTSVGRRVRKIADAYQEHASTELSWRYDRIRLLVVSEDRALLRHTKSVICSDV